MQSGPLRVSGELLPERVFGSKSFSFPARIAPKAAFLAAFDRPERRQEGRTNAAFTRGE